MKMKDDFLAYTQKIDKVLNFFKTSASGLSSKEALERLERYGKNVLEEQTTSHFILFVKQLKSILIYVLILAAIISAIAGKWVDFFAITFMILVNTLIGFWQEVKAAVSIAALKKITQTKEKVYRDGKLIEVYSADLVIGDIVYLFEGTAITADMRLIESNSLVVDESMLTGESIPVVKNHEPIFDEKTFMYDRKNMVFAGTNVVNGLGKAVVIATGKRTYFANIAEKAKEDSPDSPLTKALKYFAKFYTLFLICILFVIGVLAYFQGRGLFNIAYILIAELVSAVPEGLPIVVTLVMVIGSLRLSRKKTYVRHLPAVETLGSATVIASDKTGTITEGKIVVSEIFSEDKGSLQQAAVLCNDAVEGKGDPLDLALNEWSDEKIHIKEKYKRTWSQPFDSKLRLMAAAYNIDNADTLFVKGAYEEIKNMAVKGQSLDVYDEKIKALSSKGLRVIAFGRGVFKSKTLKENQIEIIGLIGFLDPPKKDVKNAVLSAKKAKMHVIMLTGDYPLTAKAIAEKVGIYSEGDDLLVGSDIDSLDDNVLFEKLKKTTVLARVLPEHKYRVVQILQKNNETVVVSGDGVNDVPALKIADLGIAMGSGTEAAKSISKMVIGDNNLNIIVEAIKNGRVIADNIRKVVYYLLSSSIQELFLITSAVLLNLPLPLLPLQILWINLVTDGVQDKTFPFCKEESDVMDRFPKKPNKQFFDLSQVLRILYFGFIMGGLTLLLFKHLLSTFSYKEAVTITFTSVVVTQWFNGIQAQKEKQPFFMNIKRSFSINPLIFLGVGIGVMLQLIAIYVVPDAFGCSFMSLSQWKYPIFLSLSAFILLEVRKWGEFIYNKIFN